MTYRLGRVTTCGLTFGRVVHFNRGRYTTWVFGRIGRSIIDLIHLYLYHFGPHCVDRGNIGGQTAIIVHFVRNNVRFTPSMFVLVLLCSTRRVGFVTHYRDTTSYLGRGHFVLQIGRFICSMGLLLVYVLVHSRGTTNTFIGVGRFGVRILNCFRGTGTPHCGICRVVSFLYFFLWTPIFFSTF